MLRVERAMGYAGEGARTELKDPKRRKKRAVNIPPAALALLREHRARQDEQRREAGAQWQEHGLVFASAVGTPIQPDNLLRAHRALIAQAGVTPIRFHDLRHTFATLALTGDDDLGEADLKVISESMGHADVSMTLRVYAHILPARRRGLAARMGHVLFGEPMADAAEGGAGDAPEHGDCS